MSSQPKKIVFIPVEIISRELDYKMLLAATLATPDTYCFIGQHNLLNALLKDLKGGVYFGKNIFPDRLPCNMSYYELLKEQNFSLAFFHEEGGVLGGEEQEWKIELQKQVDPKYLSNDDAILSWGQFQKEFYETLISKSEPKVHNVGCPRFDLRPDDELYLLNEKVSRVKESGYILFNTNFAAPNHHVDNLAWYKFTVKDNSDIDNTLNALSIYNESMQVMGNFLSMITELLIQFPEKKFYLRPHPSESIDFYRVLFESFQNIEIVRKYTAVEWLLGCDLLIQNGCTTSVEAHFMNKKIISYYPSSNKSNVNITQGIGYRASNIDEVKEILMNLENKPVQNNNLEDISKLINNFVSSSSLHSIVDILNTMLNAKDAVPINISKIKFSAYAHSIKIKIKELGRFLSKERSNNIKYFRSNFPGFKSSIIKEKLSNIEGVVDKDLQMTFVTEELFLITQQNNSNK